MKEISYFDLTDINSKNSKTNFENYDNFSYGLFLKNNKNLLY